MCFHKILTMFVIAELPILPESAEISPGNKPICPILRRTNLTISLIVETFLLFNVECDSRYLPDCCTKNLPDCTMHAMEVVCMMQMLAALRLV